MVQINSVSKPEAVKQQSRQLRGHIARDLADTTVPFDKEGYSLLKFHGIYQGYDRDSASAFRAGGSLPSSISPSTRSPTVTPTGRCGSRPGRASSSTASSRPGSNRRLPRSMLRY